MAGAVEMELRPGRRREGRRRGRGKGGERREVACLLVPRFPLACELAERPGLGGSPVAVSRAGAPVVWAASPEAEARGVREGQTLSSAIGLCPTLSVVEGRPAVYDAAAGEILDRLEGGAPAVEAGPPGVAWVEWVDRLARCSPGARREVLLGCAPAPLGPRLGVAPTKFAALLAARQAKAGQVVAVEEHRLGAFLAAQPVTALPVSPEVRRRLDLLGLTTLGQLARLPRSALVAQFGPEGGQVWGMARGRAEPLRPRERREEVLGRLRLEEPLAGREALAAAFEEALATALAHPLLRGRAVRQARLHARTERGAAWDRAVTFKEALTDRRRLWAVLRTHVEDARLPGPVSEVVVGLGGLCRPQGRQGELLPARLAPRRPPAGRGAERLEECLRQLEARYGYCPVGRVVVLEPWSRIPERRMALASFDL